MLRMDEPKGLERAYCGVCDSTFTVVKGQCTGCIRREDNRKQGLVYIICGAPLAAIGALGVLSFGLNLIGIACVVTLGIGLGITFRGAGAVLSGRSAE